MNLMNKLSLRRHLHRKVLEQIEQGIQIDDRLSQSRLEMIFVGILYYNSIVRRYLLLKRFSLFVFVILQFQGPSATQLWRKNTKKMNLQNGFYLPVS